MLKINAEARKNEEKWHSNAIPFKKRFWEKRMQKAHKNYGFDVNIKPTITMGVSDFPAPTKTEKEISK